MSKQYTSSVILRESRPRSLRLQGLGRSASASVASAVLPDSAWSDLFELVVVSDGENESYAIRAKYALYSDDEITAGGIGATGSETAGVSNLREMLDVYHNDSIVLRSDGQSGAQNGDVLAYDATNRRWYAKPSGEGGVSAYADLTGKPAINDHVLATGNNTLAYLGIAAANHTHSGYVTQAALRTAEVAYSDIASEVEDYASSSNTIKIGYYGQSLTTADYFAMYATVNGQTVIKDMAIATVKDLLGIPDDYLTLQGLASEDVTVRSIYIPSSSISGAMRIGNAYLWYDSQNGALCVSGANGSSMGLYATGDVCAGGGAAGGSGAFSWTPVLNSGVEIARLSINGGSPISVYAPEGGGGVSSYADLSGKPSINGHVLAAGNNTLAYLGIAAAGHTHSGYALSNHTHSDYLPLEAGSSKPLTGDLYTGSHKIYFDSTHYLEYDSSSGAFHFNAAVYADGDITAS